MSDIQYIVFTVLSQMAVGALIALVIADFLAKDEKSEMFYEAASYIILPAVIIAAIAIFVPILPNVAISYRILFNPETAWVTRETITMALFSIWALIYTILWVLHPEYGSLRGKVGLVDKIVDKLVGSSVKEVRQAVGLLAIFISMLFVTSSGMTYVLIALPILNHFTTPLFFIMTALLVGPTTVAAVLSFKYKRIAEVEAKKYTETLSTYLGTIWKFVLVATIALLALIAIHLQFLQSPAIGPAGRMTLEGMLSGEYAMLFLPRIIIGIVVTLILLVGVMLSLKAENMPRAANLMLGIFASVLIGEILGRMLFFEFAHASAYLFEAIPLLGL